MKVHEAWPLEVVREEPDLTLEEIRAKLIAAQGVEVGPSSLWRFFDRHGISFKKGVRAPEQNRPDVVALRGGELSSQVSMRAGW